MSSTPPDDVTALLHAAAQGDAQALEQVMSRVYAELQRLASQRLRHESPGHTLDTTALVHEAYLRLVDQRQTEWRNRAHFFAVASEMMRRILVDHARHRARAKRGGGQAGLSLEALGDDQPVAAMADDDADLIVAIDAALGRLAAFNPEGARIVQLRFFGGLSNQEVADVTDSSERTVRRSWALAKAWLRRELSAHSPPPWTP